MKLQVGDLIEVHGWIMSKGLDAGRYRVAAISERHGKPSYKFARPRGQRIIAHHFADWIDGWVQTGGLNQITIEQRGTV